MRKYFAVGLTLILLCAIPARAAEKKMNRVGVGYGIPYGGLGVNYEFSPVDCFSLDAGVGATSGDPGWSVGTRVYFVTQEKTFRPRISVSYGTVALLESATGKWKNDNGLSSGLGFQWVFGEKKEWSVDFDLLYLFYDMPAGYEEDWDSGNVKFTIGFGYHF